MAKQVKLTESIGKLVAGINSIKLDKRNPTPTTDNECAKCQMLEVKIEQLQKLMQGWDKTETEIKVEALKSVLRLQKPLLPSYNVVTVFDIEKRIKEFDYGANA